MRYLEKYNVSRETYEEVRRNPGFFFREKCEVNRNDCGYERAAKRNKNVRFIYRCGIMQVVTAE